MRGTSNSGLKVRCVGMLQENVSKFRNNMLGVIVNRMVCMGWGHDSLGIDATASWENHRGIFCVDIQTTAWLIHNVTSLGCVMFISFWPNSLSVRLFCNVNLLYWEVKMMQSEDILAITQTHWRTTETLLSSLRQNNVNLAKVYSIVGSFFGSTQNVPFTKWSLYWPVFEGFRAKDPHFTYWVHADKESRIKNLMWAQGISWL